MQTPAKTGWFTRHIWLWHAMFKSECFQTDFFFSSTGSIILTSRVGGGMSCKAAWESSGGSARALLGQVMVYGCRVDGVFLCAGAALACCSYIDHTARPPKRRKVGTQDQGWTG